MDNICLENKNFTEIFLIRNKTNGPYEFHNADICSDDSSSPKYLIAIVVGIALTISNFGYDEKKRIFFKQHRGVRELLHILVPKIVSVLCLFTSALLAPIILTFLAACALYRFCVQIILSRKFPESFVGLLDGTDAVWAVEDTSKNIINVLAFVEIENIQDFIQEMKRKMISIIHNENFQKVTYLREKYMGYYYWKKQPFNVDNYVREMRVLEGCENGLKDDILKELISQYSNCELPADHHASWEILVGTQPLVNKKTESLPIYPVLFRIHHSVGDGFALMQILLNILADEKCSQDFLITHDNFRNRNIFYRLKRKLVLCVMHILLFIFAPGCLLQQMFMRNIDKNILHGSELLGEKIVTWMVEDDEYPVLDVVKKLRRKNEGTSFTDILLTALSEGLNKYFEQNTKDIPQSVTVVIPARVTDIRKDTKVIRLLNKVHTGCLLQNRFSVAMLNLPITLNETGTGTEKFSDERLQEVKKETQMLKDAPDFQINYWLLSVVAKLLPEILLHPMVQSAHSTLVVSSVPGPPKISICGGNPVKDLVFSMPNRGLTGVGVSILSYADKLQIGITADRILIPYVEDAQVILTEFVESLRRMEQESY